MWDSAEALVSYPLYVSAQAVPFVRGGFACPIPVLPFALIPVRSSSGFELPPPAPAYQRSRLYAGRAPGSGRVPRR